jgi:predicted AlkP superfamily phosphohydrolase/phosphomutase
MLPRQVHEAVWRRLPPALRARRHGHLQTAQSDLAGELLFRVAHDGHPAFRVNLRGREEDGPVAPGDDSRVLRELETLAKGLTTPDGVPAFTGMWRSSEAPGPRAHRLPDGILLTNPELKRVEELVGPGGLRLHTAAKERRNGIHTGEGFLFARLRDRTLSRADVNALDFAPSALELLGIEVPDFDGKSFVA